MKRNIIIAFCLTIFIGGLSIAQPTTPPYTGGLEYSLPWLTTVPPVVSGMPSDIAAVYGYFDLAMRLSPSGSTYNFIKSLHSGDTANYFADYLYRIDDYNPVFFHQWLALNIKPYPYLNTPGSTYQELIAQLAQVFKDTDRTWMLLSSDIIAHVHITDTTMYHRATGKPYPDWAVVNAQIVDEIKGQYIPGCPLLEHPGKGGAPAPLSIFQTYADSVGLGTAGTGTCIQFNYSLQWTREPQRHYDNDFFDDDGSNPCMDSAGGAWIKPGQDYIVFLRFMGLGGDSLNHYITIWPVGSFGWSAGMYQIKSVSGSLKVIDTNDDFGIGANAGLSPDAWKTALRTRIYKLINP